VQFPKRVSNRETPRSWMRDGLDFKSETNSGKCGLYDILFESCSF